MHKFLERHLPNIVIVLIGIALIVSVYVGGERLENDNKMCTGLGGKLVAIDKPTRHWFCLVYLKELKGTESSNATKD